MEPVPQDVEMEAGLLATLAADGNEHVASLELPKLVPEDFMHPAHRAVFLALREMHAERMENGHYSIKAVMERQGTIGRIGGVTGILDLLAKPEIRRPSIYVEKLQAKRRRRDLMKLGDRLKRDAMDENLQPEEVISETMGIMREIQDSGRLVTSTTARNILHRMAHFEPLRSGSNITMGHWGIATLDRLCPIPAGEFTAIRARPGVGKSTLMAQVACESAKKGQHVLIVTMEVPREDLEARVASHIIGFNLTKLRAGDYGADEVNAMGREEKALDRIHYIDPKPGTPWAVIEAMARYEINRHDIGLILLDQFDKIGRPPVGKGSSEAYAFGAVSISIMAMVKETRIGFCLLAQLKADAEGKMPGLNDGADSDRPAKDAGLVVDLWRQGYVTKARIQKNRNGPGEGVIVTIDFDGAHQRLNEKERETEPSSYQRAPNRPLV
jgi:replicative DNA helicase